jgi:hypothetical protein
MIGSIRQLGLNSWQIFLLGMGASWIGALYVVVPAPSKGIHPACFIARFPNSDPERGTLWVQRIIARAKSNRTLVQKRPCVQGRPLFERAFPLASRFSPSCPIVPPIVDQRAHKLGNQRTPL